MSSPRSIAKAAGEPLYRSNKPCPRDHNSARYTSSGRCKKCCRDAGNNWYRSDPERSRRTRKAWYDANPGISAVYVARRKATRLKAEGSHTIEDIHQLLEAQGCSCWCGVSFFVVNPTIDHKIPLSRGGSNWPTNLQMLCQPCNDSKGSKTMEEWVHGSILTSISI